MKHLYRKPLFRALLALSFVTAAAQAAGLGSAVPIVSTLATMWSAVQAGGYYLTGIGVIMGAANMYGRHHDWVHIGSGTAGMLSIGSVILGSTALISTAIPGGLGATV